VYFTVLTQSCQPSTPPKSQPERALASRCGGEFCVDSPEGAIVVRHHTACGQSVRRTPQRGAPAVAGAGR
jgi:hypothetical protein